MCLYSKDGNLYSIKLENVKSPKQNLISEARIMRKITQSTTSDFKISPNYIIHGYASPDPG